MKDDKVVKLQHRHSKLLSLRSGYDSAWQDLAKHFMPTKWRDVGKNPSAYKGENILNPELVNTTGVLAVRTLAAGLQGGMTSPARPWFALSLEDQDMQNNEAMNSWLDEVAERMRTTLSRSNFYNVIHTLYGELGTFGTAFMMLVGDYEQGVRFIPFSVGEYCLDTNEKHMVDVCFRRFQMSARQLVQRFGKENVPQYVLDTSNRQAQYATEERFTVVHVLYPRNEYRKESNRLATQMPVASVYYLDGITGTGNNSSSGINSKSHLLSESGFEEFPGFGVRWDVTSGDVYGRSPAMEVLPDCKMLQQMDTSLLKAVHKMVDPPTSVSASLKSTGLDLTPGGVNYVETQPGQSPQAATPILQISPEIQATLVMKDRVEKQIQDGLYNDLFRMILNSDRRQITATEVAAKEDEKLILIGPVLERLNSELFNPLIERLFNLMWRLGELPPPPQIEGLADVEIKVQFVSILAQAQKSVDISGIDRYGAFAGGMAQMYPDVLDTIDIDEAANAYAEALGLSPKVLRSQDERDEMRAARQQAMEAQAQQAQQAQQMQMMQESMQGAGDMAYKLSQSNLDDNSALNAILGGDMSGALQ